MRAITGDDEPKWVEAVSSEPIRVKTGPRELAEPVGEAVSETVRMTAWVRGRVQRVGFRWFTREAALRIGDLRGFTVNLGDGRVHVVAEGATERCAALLDWLRTGDTPGDVDGVTEIWGSPRGGYEGFEIR